MSVAQGIRGPCGFDVVLTFLPALCSLMRTADERRFLTQIYADNVAVSATIRVLIRADPRFALVRKGLGGPL